MDGEAILIAVGGVLAATAAIALVAWLTYRAFLTKRSRGYVLIPPPGKHSAMRRKGDSATTAAAAPVAAGGDETIHIVQPVAARPKAEVPPRARVPRPAEVPPHPPELGLPVERVEIPIEVAIRSSDVGEPTPAVGVGRADRRLVAPVELWFGEMCVGVVAGSDTHKRFDHYASALLSEMGVPAKRAYRVAQPAPVREGWLAKRLRLRNDYARQPTRR